MRRLGSLTSLTADVSFHGLLLLAHLPPPLGQLLQLLVCVPDEAPIRVLGVAVRLEESLRGDVHAAGIKLVGASDRWDHLVRELRRISVSGMHARPDIMTDLDLSRARG